MEEKNPKNGKRVRWRGGPKPMRDPTPKEIKEETRKIRATWDERTHYIRAGFSAKEADHIMRWIPPTITFQDLMDAAMGEGLYVDLRHFNEDSSD